MRLLKNSVFALSLSITLLMVNSCSSGFSREIMAIKQSAVRKKLGEKLCISFLIVSPKAVEYSSRSNFVSNSQEIRFALGESLKKSGVFEEVLYSFQCRDAWNMSVAISAFDYRLVNQRKEQEAQIIFLYVLKDLKGSVWSFDVASSAQAPLVSKVASDQDKFVLVEKSIQSNFEKFIQRIDSSYYVLSGSKAPAFSPSNSFPPDRKETPEGGRDENQTDKMDSSRQEESSDPGAMEATGNQDGQKQP